MRIYISILLCIFISSAYRVVTAADFPRVSGIVGQEGAWVLAIVETGAGECKVISRGESFGHGVVLDITSQGIKVHYPDRDEFLPLQGGSFITTGEADYRLNAATPRTTSHTISRDEVVAALAQAKVKLASEKNRSVNEIIGLPLSARISSVNFRSTSTQQEAAQIVREELEKGNIPRINVTGVPGLTEIYLVPDTPFVPPPLADTAQ